MRTLSDAALGLVPVSALQQSGDGGAPSAAAWEQGAGAAAPDVPGQAGNKAVEAGSDHKLPIRLHAISLRSSSGEPSSHGKHSKWRLCAHLNTHATAMKGRLVGSFLHPCLG